MTKFSISTIGLFSRVKLQIIILFTLLLSQNCKASNFYWVGGSGNWSDYGNHWATTSGGLIFHTTIPTLNDDVFFDINSFTPGSDTVYLDSTFIYCKNMNWSGALYSPALVPLTYSPNNIIVNVYGSLTLIPGLYVQADFKLLASSGNQSITTAGCSFDWYTNISINGAANFSLNGNFNAPQLTINNGTLNSNNYNLTVSTIRTNGGTFNAGFSLITCSNWSNSYSTNTLIINTANASVIFDASSTDIFSFFNSPVPLQLDSVTVLSPSCASYINLICNYFIASGSASFDTWALSNSIPYQIHKAVLLGDVDFAVSFHADSLLLNNPGHSVFIGDSLVINQAITSSATCSQLTTLAGSSFQPSTIYKSSGTVSLNYLILSYMHATGGATFTANNSVDAGNNTGWTINSAAPRNLFWVNGTGNWTDAAHWALTSGGAGGNCMPTLNDNVSFDANSFTSVNNDTVYLDLPAAYCKNMNWSGALYSPALVPLTYSPNNIIVNVYGSLTLIPGLYVQADFKLLASSGNQSITTAGCSFDWYTNISINGAANFSLNGNFNAPQLTINNGTLNSNNYNLTVSTIRTNGGTFNAGFSLITCSNWSNSYSTNTLIINTANASVIFDASSTDIFSFFNSPVPLQLDSVTVLSPSCASYINLICNYFIASGSASFDTWALSNSIPYQIHKAVLLGDVDFAVSFHADSLLLNNPGHSVFIGDSLVINQAITSSATCSQLTTLAGSSFQPSTIYKSSGTVSLNYLILSYMHATGGATFTANNSVDAGNNTGWTINSAAPRNLFWVNGTGNWTDAAHWALTSGGAGGNCMPTLNDNVSFDANSFTSVNNDTVYLDLPAAYCKNMNWSGALYSPALVPLTYSPNNIIVNVYGSLTLIPGLYVQADFKLLASSGNQSITTAGCSFDWYTNISINGAANFSLNGNFNAPQLTINNGTLNSNNYNLTVSTIRTNGGTFNAGFSLITCSNWSNSYSTNTLIINTANASVIFDASSTDIFSFFNSPVPLQLDSVTVLSPSCASYINLICNYFIASGSASFDTWALSNSIPYQIHKAVLLGDVDFAVSFHADSLLLNNPGHSVFIGDSLVINNELLTYTLPGFPISLSGGVISKPSGQVCLDYYLIQNSIATGGAQFFAGSNSSDLGGNSGWSFTSCAPNYTNVWPGDANYDLVADNIDILNIGVAYGNTGTTRSGANLTWVAQPSQTWLTQFITGTNLNNADCDGNGLVDAADTLAVSMNYGQTHPPRLSSPTTNLTGPPLFFEIPPTNLTPGSNVTIPIKFGDVSSQVTNLYGIAFTVNYGASFIVPGSVSITYTNSWLVPSGNYIHLEKDFYSSGKTDMALCRTNHQNISGYGTIAFLNFTVANNASGLLQLSFSNIKAISANEIDIPVNSIPATVVTGMENVISDNYFIIYPNPANDKIYFSFDPEKIKQVEIFDDLGQKVMSASGIQKKYLEITSLEKGIYLLRALLTNEKIFNTRFLKK